MADVIKLLPDSVANQIAAGEVIQRPASLVKELVENAIDAGADNITVNVKDSGKTLVQIIDNGCGMSETDARLCWERHATSKIRIANDLFSIQTMGFRGEALASIAAVSEVSLKTKRKEDELGTSIHISGSEILSHEPVSCSEGSNFSVKNLFYNIPARRKFLKTNSSELRHIINDFNRLAIAYPGIEFSLIHDNSQIYNLPKTSLRQRIISVIGKNLAQSLIPVNADTSLTQITGFIGKPEYARRSYGEQFFFVNNRFIKQPYFHKAVIQAYDQILSSELVPSYFIFFQTDPSKIDINIHPTKTEIKFEDETAIWQILYAVVKESIGKYNLMPSLDFNNEGVIDIPVFNRDAEVRYPKENVNKAFNPFEQEENDEYRRSREFTGNQRVPPANWETLYSGTKFDKENGKKDFQEYVTPGNTENSTFLQVKSRFILTSVKSGLLIIDQKRAHERVLYEESLKISGDEAFATQQSLFPETIELNPSDYVTLTEILDQINQLGFDIRELGNNTIVVNAIPATAKNSDLQDMIDEFLGVYKSYQGDLKIEAKERIARSMARASAIPYGKLLEQEEMRELVDQLFGCSEPNFSPTGKPVMKIISVDEIDKILK